MARSQPISRLFVAGAVAWQFVVYVLSCAGIFGDIYWLLGIPWTATGFTNVFGTTLGLILLESPLLIAAAMTTWRCRKTIDCEKGDL
jgi:hypothetical protein